MLDPTPSFRSLVTVGVASLVLCLTPFGASDSAEAKGFPKITRAERDLTSVPGQSTAPAVVLFERADLRFSPSGVDDNSTLEVVRRLKILTPEGLDLAQYQIFHSRRVRLVDLEARTVLPDGREIEVDDDDIFRDRTSKSSKEFLTKVVMPGAEVGAILDLAYTLSWPGVFYLDPWVFDSSIPTRLSEITYHQPENLALKFWAVETTSIPIQREDGKSARGSTVRVWMENLPALPDEPLSFPAIDLASRFLAIPTTLMRGNNRVPLLADWETTAEFFEEGYRRFRKKASDAEARGKSLAAGAATRLEAAETIFRFVRDEIETSGGFDTAVGDDDADRLLREGSGSVTEKALLLQAMLQGAKIDSDLLWVANRLDGRVDTSVANPSAFDGSVVMARIDGADVLLDPSDPGLAPGQLSPLYEGMPALRLSNRVDLVELPWSPAAENYSKARVSLALDTDGHLRGSGSMALGGAVAWAEIGGDDEALLEEWQESLDESYPGFVVSELVTTALPDDRQVTLSWSLEQREEDVLGDEASIFPARPLVTSQPFVQPPSQRLSPIQTLYAKVDEVETTVRYPEGWTVDALPRPVDSANEAGAFRSRCEVDEAEQTVRCRRRFERSRAEYLGKQPYTLIQQLYEKAATHDAQSLVLVAP